MPPGMTGTHMTVAEAKRKIRAGARHRLVQAMRDELVRNLPEHDKRAEAQAIYDFACKAIRYTDDGETESVKSPQFVIQEYIEGRRTPADCVTETILIGALARSLRIPVRIRMTGGRRPRPNFKHVHVELFIDGKWTALDTTAAKAESMTVRNRAGLGYRHPAAVERFLPVRERPMYVTTRTPARARRRRLGRLGRLGAEAPKEETVATTKAAAAGAAKGSVLGPLGTAGGAILGAGLKILQGVGLAKKARAGRIDAMNQLVKWQSAASSFKKQTLQFKGKPMVDSGYEGFVRLALDTHYGTHISGAQFAVEAGL